MKTRTKVGLLILSLMVVGLLAFQSGPKSSFNWIVTKKLTVQNGGATFAGDLALGTNDITAGDADLSGTLDVDGNVSSGTGAFTITDSVDVSGDLTIDDTFNIDDTAYSSVGAQTLDPSASMYLMSPATTLTLTLATTTSVTGDFVWFVSTVATDTVIVDTGATAGGGNRTLGTAGDVIGFIFNGSAWVEAFYSDNS